MRTAIEPAITSTGRQAQPLHLARRGSDQNIRLCRFAQITGAEPKTSSVLATVCRLFHFGLGLSRSGRSNPVATVRSLKQTIHIPSSPALHPPWSSGPQPDSTVHQSRGSLRLPGRERRGRVKQLHRCGAVRELDQRERSPRQARTTPPSAPSSDRCRLCRSASQIKPRSQSPAAV